MLELKYFPSFFRHQLPELREQLRRASQGASEQRAGVQGTEAGAIGGEGRKTQEKDRDKRFRRRWGTARKTAEMLLSLAC